MQTFTISLSSYELSCALLHIFTLFVALLPDFLKPVYRREYCTFFILADPNQLVEPSLARI